MNDEEILDAVTEACGWKKASRGPMAGYYVRGKAHSVCTPNYLTDANTATEFEALLTDEEWAHYLSQLLRPEGMYGVFDSFTIQGCKSILQRTQRERCIAFLKVKGHYEEQP